MYKTYCMYAVIFRYEIAFQVLSTHMSLTKFNLTLFKMYFIFRVMVQSLENQQKKC